MKDAPFTAWFIAVLITSAFVEEKSGTKNGKDWSVSNQFGFIEVNGERRKITIPLGKNAEPFAPGAYQFDLKESLRVGRFGNLEVDDRLPLVRLETSPAAPGEAAGAHGAKDKV